jgi:hypothetical protein
MVNEGMRLDGLDADASLSAAERRAMIEAWQSGRAHRDFDFSALGDVFPGRVRLKSAFPSALFSLFSPVDKARPILLSYDLPCVLSMDR